METEANSAEEQAIDASLTEALEEFVASNVEHDQAELAARLVAGTDGEFGEAGGIDRPIGYDEFGIRFMNLVLHRDRVMESINRVLGDSFQLGPIGAGPGRRVAKVTATGTFGQAYGEALQDVVGYRFQLPVHAHFDLDLGVDTMRFDADVILPLRLTMDLVEPLTILWHITPPSPDQVVMKVVSDSRRAAVLQKVTGLDGELRRFIVRFVERELEKPHVKRATRIDLVRLIDGAWAEIAAQFMPSTPEDRTR